jgi:endosialidase-like protein
MFSLLSVTDAAFNTAVGAGALLANTGSQNTATGAGALLSNTTGGFNTANGTFALFYNTEGQFNTANGNFALEENTTANNNTATGYGALGSITTGDANTANGTFALANNITGSSNTAVGRAALQNCTGENNTAVGESAGLNQTFGSGNVYIGHGIQGVAGENLTCRIASIFGQTAANGSAVFITSGNKLGTDTSSKRFKEDIKPMDTASEALLALKPVTFRYKTQIDPGRTSQFGLVAEDVERANPDLVVHDKDGKPYSVRYDQVNAMLLNEFLKEQQNRAGATERGRSAHGHREIADRPNSEGQRPD